MGLSGKSPRSICDERSSRSPVAAASAAALLRSAAPLLPPPEAGVPVSRSIRRTPRAYMSAEAAVAAAAAGSSGGREERAADGGALAAAARSSRRRASGASYPLVAVRPLAAAGGPDAGDDSPKSHSTPVTGW